MKTLFAYGTLMCGDIMAEVAGYPLAGEPGILKGYCRRSIKGEAYPGLTPGKGRVSGIVYQDLTETAWARLDSFEGDMYVRISVEVELDNGQQVSAQTYVIKPEYSHCLEDTEWDFAEFLRTGKTVFQQQYKGYDLL